MELGFKMKKNLENVLKFLMIPILAGSLNGCRECKDDFCKEGRYQGYEVRAYFDEFGRGVFIKSDIYVGKYFYRKAGIKAGINAKEIIKNLKDKKKFSEIIIDKEIPKGHPLEAYANLDSLEKIYNYIKENGENCYIK